MTTSPYHSPKLVEGPLLSRSKDQGGRTSYLRVCSLAILYEGHAKTKSQITRCRAGVRGHRRSPVGFAGLLTISITCSDAHGQTAARAPGIGTEESGPAARTSGSSAEADAFQTSFVLSAIDGQF